MMVKIFTVLPEQNKSIKVLFAEPHRTKPNTQKTHKMPKVWTLDLTNSSKLIRREQYMLG